MEILIGEKLSFPKTASRIIAAIAMAVSLTACPGNDSSNLNTNVNGMLINGCTNCGTLTNPAQVATVTSRSEYNNVSLDLGVFADQNQYQYYGSLNNYRGPLVLQGTMIVQSEWYEAFYGSGYGVGVGGCRIGAGTYTVQTVTAAQGVNMYGVITNMEIVANPGNIRMSVVGAMINGSKLQTFNGGGIHPSSVNGITCGAQFGAAFY